MIFGINSYLIIQADLQLPKLLILIIISLLVAQAFPLTLQNSLNSILRIIYLRKLDQNAMIYLLLPKLKHGLVIYWMLTQMPLLVLETRLLLLFKFINCWFPFVNNSTLISKSAVLSIYPKLNNGIIFLML